jgi:hypothetical protein
LPLRADPVISKVTGACVGGGGVADCGAEAVADRGVGAGGAASCECKARGDKITSKM